MRRCSLIIVWVAIGLVAAGCPKGKPEYSAGEKAFDLRDFDAAVDFYLKASKADPRNANYKIKLNQSRFEAGQQHIHQGVKLRDQGDLQGAVSEFQRAQVLDPSSVVADQAVKKPLDMIAERSKSAQNEEQPTEPGEAV